MSDQKQATIIWVDIETTGLDPEVDRVIEVACVATDDELNELGRISTLVDPGMRKITVDLTVAEMHGSNGLWGELKEGAPTVSEAACTLAEWYEGVAGVAGQLVMAGASVHFDRAFLKAQMPNFEELFHYRNFDVSTLKHALRMWAPATYEVMEWPEPQVAKAGALGGSRPHRALDDILFTIAEARVIRKAIQTFDPHEPTEPTEPAGDFRDYGDDGDTGTDSGTQ